MKKIALLSLLALTSLTAFAAPKTVTLEVPTMYCVACPFKVKNALKNVEGVSKAEVTF
ncbi:cation transporter, partial [Salmonella enterica]